MRELIARLICFATVALVLALAHVFAARHNPARVTPRPGEVATLAPPLLDVGTPTPLPAQPAKPAVPPVSAAVIARGRQVYAERGCASCHAIGGAGNPRHALDGVGARLSPEELAEWVTGTGRAAKELPASIVRRKERYREIPADDFNAVVGYLGSLLPAP